MEEILSTLNVLCKMYDVLDFNCVIYCFVNNLYLCIFLFITNKDIIMKSF